MFKLFLMCEEERAERSKYFAFVIHPVIFYLHSRVAIKKNKYYSFYQKTLTAIFKNLNIFFSSRGKKKTN